MGIPKKAGYHMDKNLSSEITNFISTEGTLVKANKVYDAFEKKGYSDSQIAGVLRRLKESGRLVSPKRGYYENTTSKNVLDELKRDINLLVDKYNRSIPITIFTALEDSAKDEYTTIINTLNSLV